MGPLKSTYEAGMEGNKKMSAIKPVIMNMHLLLVKTKIFLVMDLLKKKKVYCVVHF